MLSNTRVRPRDATAGDDDGRTASQRALTHARTVAGVQAAIRAASVRGLCVDFGLDSAADVATNFGGDVLALAAGFTRPAVTSIDWERQTAWIPAGATIAEASDELLRQGWTLSTLGGTSGATLAGAIALDARGPFRTSDNAGKPLVRTINFVDGEGDLRQLGGTEPASDSSAAWGVDAIVGGLGLTGICTEVEVHLRPVNTGWMLVDSTRCENAADLLSALVDADGDSYAFARVDPTGVGASLGRGVVLSARHARVTDLPETRQANALEFVPNSRARATPKLSTHLLGAATNRRLQGITHKTAPAARRDELVPIASYFHGDADAREACKVTADSLTYEFTVVLEHADLITEFLDRLTHAGVPCTSATVRRAPLRPTGPLGVATDGWTLTTELTPTTSGIGRLLDEWDERVAASGGQVSLAEDSRMRPDMVPAMYPEFHRWQELRARLDPRGRFRTNLSRRLGL